MKPLLKRRYFSLPINVIRGLLLLWDFALVFLGWKNCIIWGILFMGIRNETTNCPIKGIVGSVSREIAKRFSFLILFNKASAKGSKGLPLCLPKATS